MSALQSLSRNHPARPSRAEPSATASRSSGQSPTQSLSDQVARQAFPLPVRKGAKGRGLAPLVLVSPLALYMIAFYALPLASMLLRSVADPPWTLHNSRRLATAALFRD